MKRLGFACVWVGLMAAASPSNKALATDKMPDANMKMEDCAAMMKSLIPLPTKFGELMTVVADGMDAHAAWVGASKDKAAKAEAASMKKLGKDHRDVAALMKKIVADMEAGGKLSPSPHDMTKADPKMGEGMMKQAALEREMAALMIKNADETDKMLKEMAKGAPGAK